MALVGGLIVLFLGGFAIIGMIMFVACGLLWLRPAHRRMGRRGMRAGFIGGMVGVCVYALLLMAISGSVRNFELEIAFAFGATGFGWFSLPAMLVGSSSGGEASSADMN